MNPKVPIIDADRLRRQLDSGEPVTVLDIRPAAERAEWSIPGSVHVDAYCDLWAGRPETLDRATLPRGVPVVTVCAAGNTSKLAAEYLIGRGYDVRSLAGGMKAWSTAWNLALVPGPAGSSTVLQVRRTGKGCLSYLIGSGAEAAVLDACLDPGVYVELARERGWTLTRVLETHVHADHVSRGRALAERTGASLHVPEQQRARYPFIPVRDGDSIPFGATRLVALRTPGHTQESTCYELEGWALLSGDTLFLNAVGRPDLEAGSVLARDFAHTLHRSLARLVALSPELLVLPGHTSQPVPFDGVPIAAPLGEVTPRIELLALGEEAFVDAVLARLSDTPPNYGKILELNESGTLPAGDLAELEAGANRCAVG